MTSESIKQPGRDAAWNLMTMDLHSPSGLQVRSLPGHKQGVICNYLNSTLNWDLSICFAEIHKQLLSDRLNHTQQQHLMEPWMAQEGGIPPEAKVTPWKIDIEPEHPLGCRGK